MKGYAQVHKTEKWPWLLKKRLFVTIPLYAFFNLTIGYSCSLSGSLIHFHMNKKHLFKAAAVVFAAILFNNSAKAQTTKDGPWRLGVGIEAGLPVGTNASDISSFVLGGTARLQYSVSDKVALTLTSGYYDFLSKTYTAYTTTATSVTTQQVKENFGVVPVKVGFKDFFDKNIYFGAEVGAAFQTGGVTRLGNTKLDIAPALGFACKDWDISARYENMSGNGTLAFVGLRAAYSFGL